MKAQLKFLPHPKAIPMPKLSEKVYQALKASVEDHGQLHPIQVLKGTPVRRELDQKSPAKISAPGTHIDRANDGPLPPSCLDSCSPRNIRCP
jgi:hypothetical protein